VFILREKAGLLDFVKIIDFGISKFEQAGTLHPRITSSGAVLGTPCYMSPEQARGTTVDPRSDLHSVGVILFEAVTGRVPFSGQNFNELMFQIATGDRPHARDFVPDLDPRFEAIIDRAMQRDPEKRYQSAREFQRELEGWMRANSLSTTTGETLLSDVDDAIKALRQSKAGRGADKSAPTLAADTESEVIGTRRTVTNASMDTLATPKRRNRGRWMIAGGFAAGAIVGVMVLITSGKTKELATDSPVSSAAAAAASGDPSAPSVSAPLPSVASAGPSTSAAPDAVSSSASHTPDPRRKVKPAKGSPHPTSTSKQVDFGY
jgi:serine/threonine-protein kinase